MIKLTWDEIKSQSDSRLISLQYVESDDEYKIYLADGSLVFYTFLEKNPSDTTNIDDFEANYKPNGNKSVVKQDYDGRTITHSTPRYRGTSTTFTSIDDDQTNPSKIWGGSNKLNLHHQIGQPTTQTVYMDFNTIDNRTYLLTGNLAWKNALLDEVTCQVVPKLTTYSAGINTDYDLYGGYLIIPNDSSTGSITVNDADRVLVQVPLNEYGEMASSGYWDADYNTTTKQFENIVPNATATGAFNMFGVEVVLYSYLNQVCMIGDQNESLTSYDADQLGHGTRLKFTFNTIGADHEWYFAGSIAMFREKSA